MPRAGRSTAPPDGLGSRIDDARRAEEAARARFISATLGNETDEHSVDRLRLDWVRAGEELDSLLVTLLSSIAGAADGANAPRSDDP